MADPTSQDFLELSHQVVLLQEQLKNRDELESLRREAKDGSNALNLTRLEEALGYKTELGEFKADVHLQLSYFKWIAWSAGACVALLGFLGFKGWSDITRSADTLMSKQLAEMSDRYSNLSRAFSLQDSGRSSDALPYLKSLYDSNHYDEPVVRAYFEAMDNLGDCDGIAARYAELADIRSKFDSIKDASVFNTLGFTLRNCSPNIPGGLSLAKGLLEQSLKRFSNADPMRRYPLYNLFTIAFIEGDIARAKNYLENSSTIVDDYPDDIEGAKKEVWFSQLAKKRPSAGKELDVLWVAAKELQRQTFKKGS